MRKLLYTITALMFLQGTVANGSPQFIKNDFPVQDLPPTTSLVYPGTDGNLVYVADSLENIIPDFSYAGYKGGGVPIPYVATKEIVWPVRGGNSKNIQAAIDKVSSLLADASGFRGAVLLKMGTYELEEPIYIRTSGVVLRGEGMGEIGTILIGKLEYMPEENIGLAMENQTNSFRRAALININGTGITLQEDTKQLITDNYVPVGAFSFNVASARGFSPGDKILIRRIGNEDFIKELYPPTNDNAGRSSWRPFNTDYDRIITSINGNTITVDAPIFCAIETRWGGGEVYKYDDAGRLEQVAIENLRGISEYDPNVRITSYGNMDRGNWDAPDRLHFEGEEYYADENHYFTFISMTNVKNGWVRNVSGLHFGSSVVSAGSGTKWITLQDCESWEPVSIRAGARRFTFQFGGQLSFAQRCFSQKGRHSFVNSTGASGNVFLDCEAINPFSTSEPHSQWLTGLLYDNVKAPLSSRFWTQGMGWAGANNVYWNCEGDYMMQKPPTAQNYSFGHIGINSVIFNTVLQDRTKPNGHIESIDKHVAPRSLYLTQLEERLGEQAVKNIITAGQSK